MGYERQRFSRTFVLAGMTCGRVEAGNEADSDTGPDRFRGLQLVGFFGGVGGVDIQVGAAGNNIRSDMHELGGVARSSFSEGVESLSGVGTPSAGGFDVSIDGGKEEVGVHTGDATMVGRGRKPPITGFGGEEVLAKREERSTHSGEEAGVGDGGRLLGFGAATLKEPAFAYSLKSAGGSGAVNRVGGGKTSILERLANACQQH